jgi:hypothetical protein
MIIPRQSIIHCHPQEFCVISVGDKIIVKAYFKFYVHGTMHHYTVSCTPEDGQVTPETCREEYC